MLKQMANIMNGLSLIPKNEFESHTQVDTTYEYVILS